MADIRIRRIDNLIRSLDDGMRSLDDQMTSLDDQLRIAEGHHRSFDRFLTSLRAWAEVDLTSDNVFNKELLGRKDIKRHMKKIILLDDGEVCSVCLQDMNVGGHALLKCSHIFHENCMSEWSKRKHDIRKEIIKA
ncbi:hypothetical protein MKW92_009348, partial [Papaver armeniacum]